MTSTTSPAVGEALIAKLLEAAGFAGACAAGSKVISIGY
jgi:hypothetical protein